MFFIKYMHELLIVFDQFKLATSQVKSKIFAKNAAAADLIFKHLLECNSRIIIEFEITPFLLRIFW